MLMNLEKPFDSPPIGDARALLEQFLVDNPSKANNLKPLLEEQDDVIVAHL